MGKIIKPEIQKSWENYVIEPGARLVVITIDPQQQMKVEASSIGILGNMGPMPLEELAQILSAVLQNAIHQWALLAHKKATNEKEKTD